MDGHSGRQTLLDRLRENDAAEPVADELQEMYHARQMASLSEDVYDAARGEGEAPHGWLRASENLELFRELLGTPDATDDQLRAMLKPDESGFRAEFYLPDPDVLGPGYKPTLVFKGSAGEVIGPDGKARSTAAEDFLGNNFPQSIGLRTDYYDRAMDLAILLKERGLDFDITGHSLGGSLASAASAVTGMRTVTWNAAGLHPETVARFARENGNLPVYDTLDTVTAWQVQGDLLNDGVQGDLAGLGARDRRRLAGILSDTASVLQSVPEARGRLEQLLTAQLPESSHPAAQAFIERLAQGDAASLIRDLPQAAGQRKPPLVAMGAAGRELLEREEAASLADLHRLARPLLTVVAASARGADAGASVGGLVDAGGGAVRDGLEWTGARSAEAWAQGGRFAGQGYRLAGITIDHGFRSVGELAADWREFGAAGESLAARLGGSIQARGYGIGAAGVRIVGEVADRMPWDSGDGASERAQRTIAKLEARAAQAQARGEQLAEAALERGRAAAGGYRVVAGAVGAAVAGEFAQRGDEARAGLQHVGGRLSAAFEGVGWQVHDVARRAPAAGATIGGTTGLLVGSVASWGVHPANGAYSLHSTVRLKEDADAAVHEAVERHGMASAVIPSLDAEIARREQAARALLEQQERGRQAAPQSSGAQSQEISGSASAGASGRALEQFLEALRSGDPARTGAASAALLDSPLGRDWLRTGEALLERGPGPLAVPRQEPASCPAPEALLPR